MMLRILQTLFCAIGVALHANSQNASQHEGLVCLSFYEAMQHGYHRDPGILLAQAQGAFADAELEAAGSRFLPRVSAFAQSGAGDNGLVSSAVENQTGLRLSQLLFDFGKTRLDRRSAESRIRESDARIEAARLEGAQLAGSLMIDLWAASERAAIARLSAGYFGTLQQTNESLFERGLATRTALAMVSARKARASSDVVAQETRRDAALAELQLVTMSTREPCGLDAQLHEIIGKIARMSLIDAELVVSSAVIREIDASIAALEYEARRASINRLPDIALSGTVAYSSLDGFSDWRTRERIGLELSVPLYNAAGLKAERQRSAAELAVARAERARLLHELKRRLSTAQTQLRALGERLELIGFAISSARQERDLKRAAVENGTDTLEGLIESEERLVNVRLEDVAIKASALSLMLEIRTLLAAHPQELFAKVSSD